MAGWGFSVLIMAAALAVPSVAQAQNMAVSTFLAKADSLKAKGMMAMLSSDVGLLKAEVKSAGIAYRADVNAGKPPKSCPPPKGLVKMDSDELIASFRTIPAPQQKTTSVRTAFANYMVKRFPCKTQS